MTNGKGLLDALVAAGEAQEVIVPGLQIDIKTGREHLITVAVVDRIGKQVGQAPLFSFQWVPRDLD